MVRNGTAESQGNLLHAENLVEVFRFGIGNYHRLPGGVLKLPAHTPPPNHTPAKIAVANCEFAVARFWNILFHFFQG